jgi:predicted O-methyltransferase YrrM
MNYSNILLSKEEIESVNLSDLSLLCIQHEEYFSGRIGEEPYKLYAFISSQYNNTVILDVGSYYGNSSLALSYNKNNTILSYDIKEHGQSSIGRENITWKIQDFRYDKSINYDEVSVILIDVDPHDGIQEVEMIEFLKEINWHGLLLLDDIHLNRDMNRFWESFKEPKTDLTAYGHHSGTGVVYF